MVYNYFEISHPKKQIHIILDRYLRKIERIRSAKKGETYLSCNGAILFVEIGPPKTHQSDNDIGKDANKPHPIWCRHDKKINITVLVGCIHREGVTDRDHSHTRYTSNFTRHTLCNSYPLFFSFVWDYFCTHEIIKSLFFVKKILHTMRVCRKLCYTNRLSVSNRS